MNPENELLSALLIIALKNKLHKALTPIFCNLPEALPPV